MLQVISLTRSHFPTPKCYLISDNYCTSSLLEAGNLREEESSVNRTCPSYAQPDRTFMQQQVCKSEWLAWIIHIAGDPEKKGKKVEEPCGFNFSHRIDLHDVHVARKLPRDLPPRLVWGRFSLAIEIKPIYEFTLEFWASPSQTYL